MNISEYNIYFKFKWINASGYVIFTKKNNTKVCTLRNFNKKYDFLCERMAACFVNNTHLTVK